MNYQPVSFIRLLSYQVLQFTRTLNYLMFPFTRPKFNQARQFTRFLNYYTLLLTNSRIIRRFIYKKNKKHSVIIYKTTELLLPFTRLLNYHTFLFTFNYQTIPCTRPINYQELVLTRPLNYQALPLIDDQDKTTLSSGHWIIRLFNLTRTSNYQESY